MMLISNILNIVFILQTDPFKGFRMGLANVLMTILGIGGAVALIVTVLHIMNGDRESAKKFAKWVVAMVVGFTLLLVIRDL